MLKEKYQELLKLGDELKVKDGNWKEEGGKLHVSGTTEYQLEKDLLWDKIKSYPEGESEVRANIKVEKTDIYGIYTVKSGDTLSQIAKKYLDNPNRYPDIFNLNQDTLQNPDLIKVGQHLKIPNK